MSAARLNDLVVCSPKACPDDTYFAKARRQSASGKKRRRLLLRLRAVHTVSAGSKASTSLNVTVNAQDADLIGAIEDALLHAARSRCAEWFGDGVQSALVEEYFVELLHYDRVACSAVLKARLHQSPTDDAKGMLETGEPMDITLSLAGLRFFKQRIVAEWDVSSIVPARADDTQPASATAASAPAPDLEERSAMAQELLGQIKGMRTRLDGMQMSLDEQATILMSAGDSAAGVPNVMVLEAAREVVDAIAAEIVRSAE